MDSESLESLGFLNATIQMILTLTLFGWDVFESLSLRTPYPPSMVALWSIPLWRIALLTTLWIGAEWSPHIGILSAVAVAFYSVDMIQII
jgi:hypothetical protein